jgi:hypothetical protein
MSATAASVLPSASRRQQLHQSCPQLHCRHKQHISPSNIVGAASSISSVLTIVGEQHALVLASASSRRNMHRFIPMYHSAEALHRPCINVCTVQLPAFCSCSDLQCYSWRLTPNQTHSHSHSQHPMHNHILWL